MSSPNLSDANSVDAATCSLSSEAMIEVGETISSLGVSLAEAAWRRSPGGARLHLQQCREALKTGVDILKRWEASLPQQGGAIGE